MTVQDGLRVLKLFGAQCPKCHGCGELSYGELDRWMVLKIVEMECNECEGAGYALKFATRPNWPWGRKDCSTCGHMRQDHFVLSGCRPGPQCECVEYKGAWRARIPDFTKEPAASQRLAQKMNAAVVFSEVGPYRPVYVDSFKMPDGSDLKFNIRYIEDTMGGALLRALEVSENA